MIFNPAYGQLFHGTSRRRTCTNISRWKLQVFRYGKWRSYNLFPVARNYDVRSQLVLRTFIFDVAQYLFMLINLNSLLQGSKHYVLFFLQLPILLLG